MGRQVDRERDKIRRWEDAKKQRIRSEKGVARRFFKIRPAELMPRRPAGLQTWKFSKNITDGSLRDG
jgi:hypothetical protein